MCAIKSRGAAWSAGVMLAVAARAASGQSTVHVIGPPPLPNAWFLPTAMSGDGHFVFGSQIVPGAGADTALRWTPEAGFLDLGRPDMSGGFFITDASQDGAAFAITLDFNFTERHVGVRWTAEDGYAQLDDPFEPSEYQVEGVSTGGAVLVGSADDAPVTWDGAGQAQFLPLPSGLVAGWAYDVSEDGSIIVGAAGTPGLERAIRWGPDRTPAILPSIPGLSGMQATHISRDATVIVGVGNHSGLDAGFRWTSQGGARLLAPTSGLSSLHPLVISGDGRVVYAVYRSSPDADYSWVIWTESSGAVSLVDHLLERGIDLGDLSIGMSVRAASDDGMTFVADRQLPGGQRSAFVVTMDQLPAGTHCPADWDYSGEVDTQDFFAFLDAFFVSSADFDGSGQTTSQDFFAFLAAFFAGC